MHFNFIVMSRLLAILLTSVSCSCDFNHDTAAERSFCSKDPGDETPSLLLLQTQTELTKVQVPVQVQTESAKVTRARADFVTLLGITERTAQRASAAGASARRYWARCHSLLRRAADQHGSSIIFVMLLLATLSVCLLVMLGGFLSPRRGAEWSMPSPAQDLLIKPQAAAVAQQTSASVARAQDPRLPPSATQATQKPATSVSANAQQSIRPVQPSSGVFGGLGSALSSLMGSAQETSISKAMVTSHKKTLMPEMVVQEPEGAQFFIDGLLVSEEQNGFMEVWRVSGDYDQRMVMKLILCEGASGAGGHHNGIMVELPDLCTMPIAFINTQFAPEGRAGNHPHAILKNRHITIFDTFTGNVDFKQPFCTAEREPRGVVLRRMTGEVICYVSSGGYNTDFGNIVDNDGRLIATLSNRGHSLLGLGMVRGAWKDNRRVVQISQGTDAVLIICAIISADRKSVV